MSRENPDVARLAKLNFHDDNLLLVEIHPPEKNANATRIDLHFRDYATQATKVLSFRGCANIRYIMDFDVLVANWFAQTERVTCGTDAGKMSRFVRSQMRDWHVKYMAPTREDPPIRKKLLSIGTYCLFRITFYGGSIHILAKGFVLLKPKRGGATKPMRTRKRDRY